MKFPKLTPSVIFALGCAMAIGYLFISGQATPTLFFIFGILIVLAIIYSAKEKRTFDFLEICEKAKLDVKDFQRDEDRIFPKGTPRIMNETDLKELEIMNPKDPHTESDKWYVGIMVDGSNRAFWFKYSIYGNLLGTTEIDMPTKARVTDIPERIQIGATPIRHEDLEKYLEDKKKREEEMRK